MTDYNIELTRRKILAGVGAIGAAGAGAGMGTSALFSDEESFTNNSITAGTLDMRVTATVEGANEYWEERAEGGQDDDLAIDGVGETADGEPVVGLSVDDVKPGDWAIICFEIEVESNPAFVQLTAENLESSENGIEEPEPDIGESGGELEDEMLALLYRSFKGVQPSNNANPPYSYLKNSSRITSPDSTVRTTYELLGNGYTLSTAAGPLVEVGSGENAVRRYLLLHLPASVGNVVQGDSFSLDLVFRAEQVRNNATPFQTERIELAGSAARNTGFQTRASGGVLGSGYWKDDPAQTNQDGGSYEQLYITFEEAFGPYYVDSLATFTIDEIQSVRYRTRRPAGASQDYFMEIFTFPDGTNDDASWYGRQLQALPGDALNENVSADTWLTWRTDSGTNQLTFYDYNHDYDTTDSNSPPYLGQDTGVTLADLQSTDSFDWSNHVSNADSTAKNYRDEEVRAFRFATGSAWQDTHEGGLDAIEITLTDGRRAVVDLES
jgi:predicted ribosomally synthesized peptide with SipW-like signal peptide